MNTHEHENRNRPRVWLVGAAPDPEDQPTVRDTRMRTWQPGEDGRYHSSDGWHHATWTELHSRFDLVEVA
jgi:protocatechuate 3,4-dioxygenase beta subunit